MLDAIRDNQALFYWLTGASIAMFVATLIAVPFAIARIPEDYFLHDERPPLIRCDRCLAARVAFFTLKNLAGVLLIAAGIAMVVLPGQGLLTIVLGILLLDFPGKFRAERWLFSRPRILKPINWLRARAGRPPLRMPAANPALG
jgi:hypothetical protein